MIKLENISKYYHNNGIVTLGLHNVNLSFSSGEFVAITGESGSGKTTLLNVIGGIDSYEDGEMLIEGEETSHYNSGDWEIYRRDKIAYIFQDYNLIDSFTVLKNVEIALIIRGLAAKERRNKALDIIKRVGLMSHCRHRAAKLSGGQKQRLAIARALAKETTVIVADEPTGNLDVQSGADIIKLLYEISAERLVLVVTHNLSAVEPYITRKIRLFDGEVVEDVICKPAAAFYPRKGDGKPGISPALRVFNISLMSIFGQPKRTALLFTVFIAVVFFTAVILGGFIRLHYEMDYSIGSWREINDYPERVIVVKKDRSALGAPDREAMLRLAGIKEVIEKDSLLDVRLHVSLKSHQYDSFSGFLNLSLNNTYNPARLTGRMPENSGEILISKSLDSEGIASLAEAINENIDVFIPRFNFSDVYKLVGIYDSGRENEEFVFSKSDLADLNDKIKIMNADYTVKCVKEHSVYEQYGKYFRVHPDLKENEVYCPEFIDETDSILYINNTEMVFLPIANVTYDYNHIFVSAAFYESLKVKEEYQYTVNLKNVASAKSVMGALYEAGYYTLHPAQNADFGIERIIMVPLKLFTFGLFLIIYAVIYLLSYIIVRTILLAKKHDYAIFRTLGLSKKGVNLIITLELLMSLLMAYIVYVILIVNLYIFAPDFKDLFFSLQPYQYALVFGLNIILILFIAGRFRRYGERENLFSVIKRGA